MAPHPGETDLSLRLSGPRYYFLFFNGSPAME